MSDWHMAYIVTLQDNVRDDEAEAIITALRMVKRVLSVEPIVADYALHVAERRARFDLDRLNDISIALSTAAATDADAAPRVTGKPASARPVRWETAELAWFIAPSQDMRPHPKNYEGPDIEQDIR